VIHVSRVLYRTYHVRDALGGDLDDLGRAGGAPGLGPPLPMEKTNRSSTPEVSGNSRLLLAAALWVMLMPSAAMLVNCGHRGRTEPLPQPRTRPTSRKS
jgi:hypothetical protein